MDKNKQLEKEVSPDKKINAINLHSPIPLLRLKKEIAAMHDGEIVEIICTDAGSGNDIANWCSKQNHTYLGEKQKEDKFSFFVEK